MAYDAEAQYVGRIEREDEGGVQLETLPEAYWEYKERFEEKKAVMWRLEGPSIMPRILRKGQNPGGAQFTRC